MVADPVVRVRVDVAQVRLVELGEGGVELRLLLRFGGHRSRTLPQAAVAFRALLTALGAVNAAVQRSGSTWPSMIPANPRSTGASTPASCSRVASSGTAATASAVWPSAAPISEAGMPRARNSPARRVWGAPEEGPPAGGPPPPPPRHALGPRPQLPPEPAHP